MKVGCWINTHLGCNIGGGNSRVAGLRSHALAALLLLASPLFAESSLTAEQKQEALKKHFGEAPADEEAREIFLRAEDVWYGRNGEYEDKVRSLDLYREAAEREVPDAMEFLAVIHRTGVRDRNDGTEVVAKDPYEAFAWAERAAKKHDSLKAMEVLAMLYYTGEGLRDGSSQEQRHSQAASWWMKGTDKGSSESMVNLGDLYRKGSGVKKDLKRALELYHKAEPKRKKHKSEHPSTQERQLLGRVYNNLAACYMSGWGTRRDNKRALEYFEKAMENGNKGASQNIKILRDLMQKKGEL